MGPALDKQQPPERNHFSLPVTDQVVCDLYKRRKKGTTKYGKELLSHNGRDPLIDLYQELLDAVLYLRQHLMERE